MTDKALEGKPAASASESEAGFDALGLSSAVLKAVSDVGFTEPTPIQRKAIPVILQGRDLVGRAQTGTGKTAAYTLPMIDILSAGRARARMSRALVLAPTRELAAQIAEHFESFGKYHPLSMALLIGGVSIEDQDRKIDRGVDVLIATPGRLLDHIENGRLILHGVKMLVIDEADRMLDMGFIPDVERIIRQVPPLRQTLMFSATIPKEVRRIADSFMMNAKEVSVAPPASPAEGIDHALQMVGKDPKAKREALRALLRREGIGEALIFCNRKKDVDTLRRSLTRHGFEDVGALHGDMSQAERTETLAAFKGGAVRLLVASDVAGRGLDISDMPCVINFDVPMNPEDYVHRIGRTGRAGKEGRAFTLGTPEDTRAIEAIERLIRKPIPRLGAAQSPDGEPEPAPARRGRSRGRAKSRKASSERTEARPKDEAQPQDKARPKDEARPQEKAQKAAPKRTAPKRKRGRKKSPDAEEHTGVGFGDHMPDFLRPTPRRDRHRAR
jgi:superfamily II DNA/RNA helicase